jgi:hypothetical protein
LTTERLRLVLDLSIPASRTQRAVRPRAGSERVERLAEILNSAIYVQDHPGLSYFQYD